MRTSKAKGLVNTSTDDYDAEAVAEDFAAQIGTVVKRFREQAGLSQRQLAALLDARQPSIVRLEVGRVTPSFVTVQRLAHVLNVKISIIIDPKGTKVKLLPVKSQEKSPERKAG